MRFLAIGAVALLWLAALGARPAAGFDLAFSIQSGFDANEVQLLTAATAQVERMWETVLTGYAPGVSVGPVVINVFPTTSGLAAAFVGGTTFQGGFVYSTGGGMIVNVNEIENFAAWPGVTSGPCLVAGTGLNYLDELLAHETGHVLGVGTLWDSNEAYVPGTFQYTGAHGLAAYRAEFDAAAAFVPVENAGSPGTPDAHWDQRMRSSTQEGDPMGPWCLDPRVGVTDAYGRDRGLEMMSGAIDPDYGEPFLSRFTVESMRDLGYTVAAFEDFNGDGSVSGADLDAWQGSFGATGLAIDSVALGDADRDRAVTGRDFLLWQQAFAAGGSAVGVPEAGGVGMMLVAVVVIVRGAAAPLKKRPGAVGDGGLTKFAMTELHL
jgi:hypothetical protein